jgi:hypothetical protein
MRSDAAASADIIAERVKRARGGCCIGTGRGANDLSPAFAGSETRWHLPGAHAPGFMLSPRFAGSNPIAARARGLKIVDVGTLAFGHWTLDVGLVFQPAAEGGVVNDDCLRALRAGGY